MNLKMHGQPQRKSQNGDRSEVKGGRCWTASQLQRKRQLDRESQRVSREKTKSKISHLESLVRSFQENDDERVRKLLKKIDDQTAEIQRLRDVIRGINRLIEGSDAPSAPAASNLNTELTKANHLTLAEECHDRQGFEQAHHEYVDILCERNDGMSAMSMQLDESIVLEDLALSDDMRTGLSQKPYTVAQLAASIAEDRSLDGRLWYLAGGVLSHLLQSSDSGSSFSASDDEDIAIRAVFEGWAAVTERHCLDIGWQWLKELDERIYYHLPAHTRLMHMRNTRLIFLNQICPSASVQKQIPPFFAPQRSRSHVQYDPLAEHFPWPGFRRRLSLSPLKFATDRFMDTLRTYVDFMWNQDSHELYTLCTLDGRYRYSDTLVRRMMDIRCYTAKREFFHTFPDLRADIPCSAISIRSLFPFATVEGAEMESEAFLREIDEE